MRDSLDVASVNLFFCLFIFIVGCFIYAKNKKNKAPFNIGVAFGIFSVSHLLTLMGMDRDFQTTILLTRIFGYLIIAFTLYNMEFSEKR